MLKKCFVLVILASMAGKSFSQTPTWSNDVAKIIYGNCTSCHRTGGIAPFNLETYEEVSAMAGWVQQAIETKSMPPWTPNPDYKHFAHERVLPSADISTIQNWVAAGTPSGNLNSAPPLPPYSNGTQLGTPDISLSISPYTVTSANDVYRNFELFVGSAQSTTLTAIEVLPGNPSIVHHVLVFQDSTTNPINTSGAGGTGSSASQLLYSYVPGASPYFTPVGTGFRLAPNTRIILQIHYAPGSNGLTDNTTVNFKTNNSNLRKITVNAVLNHSNMTDGPLVIPANQLKSFHSELQIPGNVTVLYAFPHMHLLGKSVHTWANKPISGDTVRFVKIPEWNFHWQDNFIFPNAIVLPVGTTIKAEAVYDNRDTNPNNPTIPPVPVTAGEGTLDEMFLVFFAYMPFQTGDQYLIIDKRIFAKGATNFCGGQSVRLETIAGEGYSYQWLKDGTAITGATNYFHEAFETGNYTVSITLGTNNAVSDPTLVTVSDAPVAQVLTPSTTAIPIGGTVTLSGQTGAGYLYQWYLNGNAILGATSSTFDAPYFGEYTLEVFNGTCYSISEPLLMTGGVAQTNEIAGQTEFLVFPNPAEDLISMQLNDALCGKRIAVQDATGNVLKTLTIEKSLVKIDVHDLAQGIYFVSIIDENNSIVLKKKVILR